MEEYKKFLKSKKVVELKNIARSYIKHVKFAFSGAKKNELINHLLKHTMLEDGKIKVIQSDIPIKVLIRGKDEDAVRKQINISEMDLREKEKLQRLLYGQRGGFNGKIQRLISERDELIKEDEDNLRKKHTKEIEDYNKQIEETKKQLKVVYALIKDLNNKIEEKVNEKKAIKEELKKEVINKDNISLASFIKENKQKWEKFLFQDLNKKIDVFKNLITEYKNNEPIYNFLYEEKNKAFQEWKNFVSKSDDDYDTLKYAGSVNKNNIERLCNSLKNVLMAKQNFEVGYNLNKIPIKILNKLIPKMKDCLNDDDYKYFISNINIKELKKEEEKDEVVDIYGMEDFETKDEYKVRVKKEMKDFEERQKTSLLNLFKSFSDKDEWKKSTKVEKELLCSNFKTFEKMGLDIPKHLSDYHKRWCKTKK